MTGINWQCPHCNHFVTITNERWERQSHFLDIQNALGSIGCETRFYVCPNPACKQPTFEVRFGNWSHQQGVNGRYQALATPTKVWRLYPEGASKPFPDYIPEAILNDYREACLIVNASPKASATLSRRCMQGILRDFWQVNPGNLWPEIQQIKEKIDDVTWGAIDAVRKIGNIGAHMESDINVIVDVDPGEAEMLIQLVETLLTEWYVSRHNRNERMKAITAVAAEKKAQKPPSPAAK